LKVWISCFVGHGGRFLSSQTRLLTFWTNPVSMREFEGSGAVSALPHLETSFRGNRYRAGLAQVFFFAADDQVF
jgi:hypothetical protein